MRVVVRRFSLFFFLFSENTHPTQYSIETLTTTLQIKKSLSGSRWALPEAALPPTKHWSTVEIGDLSAAQQGQISFLPKNLGGGGGAANKHFCLN
jgi:hypothetical protein